jgi:hypothetical protein
MLLFGQALSSASELADPVRRASNASGTALERGFYAIGGTVVNPQGGDGRP